MFRLLIIFFSIILFASNLMANNIFFKIKDIIFQQVSFACVTQNSWSHTGMNSNSKYNFIIKLHDKKSNRIIKFEEIIQNEKEPIDYLKAKYFKFKLTNTDDNEFLILVNDLIYSKETYLKINRINGKLWAKGKEQWVPVGECKRGTFSIPKQKF
jgi:hypothetical protein